MASELWSFACENWVYVDGFVAFAASLGEGIVAWVAIWLFFSKKKQLIDVFNSLTTLILRQRMSSIFQTLFELERLTVKDQKGEIVSLLARLLAQVEYVSKGIEQPDGPISPLRKLVSGEEPVSEGRKSYATESVRSYLNSLFEVTAKK